MSITARQLNRATLHRQMLLQRQPVDVVEAVRRVVALQAQAPASRLLPMWDSILLAYADRSRVVPPQYRPLIIRRNGDVLPTVVVDGYVAGVWRAVEEGIEATAFHRLDEGAWNGLAAEAGALLPFLAGREPAVYRRYAHWWSKPLPSAEVRMLTS